MTNQEYFQTISAYKLYVRDSLSKGNIMSLQEFEDNQFDSWESVWEAHEAFNTEEEESLESIYRSYDEQYNFSSWTLAELRNYVKTYDIPVTGDKRTKAAYVDSICTWLLTDDIDLEDGVDAELVNGEIVITQPPIPNPPSTRGAHYTFASFVDYLQWLLRRLDKSYASLYGF